MGRVVPRISLRPLFSCTCAAPLFLNSISLNSEEMDQGSVNVIKGRSTKVIEIEIPKWEGSKEDLKRKR